jgi:hypothetical protein
LLTREAPGVLKYALRVWELIKLEVPLAISKRATFGGA